jgi:hypothetical protein
MGGDGGETKECTLDVLTQIDGCCLAFDSVIWLTRCNFTLLGSGTPLSGQDGFFADFSATSCIVMLRKTMKVDLVFYGPCTRSVWHIGEIHFSKVVNFPFPWNLTTGVFGVWVWNMKLPGHKFEAFQCHFLNCATLHIWRVPVEKTFHIIW